MTYNSQEIAFLIQRFEASTLPKSEWTHEAHLFVAIWYCYQYEAEKALEKVRSGIIQHNQSVGTPNSDTEGYHETITVFWIKVATHFLQGQEYESAADACQAFVQSEMGKRTYPLAYYSKECLFSIQARHHYVAPDRKEVASI